MKGMMCRFIACLQELVVNKGTDTVPLEVLGDFTRRELGHREIKGIFRLLLQ